MTAPVSRSPGWLLLGLGLAFACFIALRTVPKLSAHGWHPATATVVASSMYARTDKSRDWCLKVSYAYTVDGRNYENSRAAPSRITSAGCDIDRAVVQRQLSALGTGAPVPIFYNPQQPAEAARYIDPLDLLDYLCGAFALVLLALGGYFLRYPGRATGAATPAPGVKRERRST